MKWDCSMSRIFATETTSWASGLIAPSVLPALAEQPDPMPGRQIHGQRAPASPSSKAFKEANRKMMYVMVVPMTGDADGVSLLL
jgi:hypothetical protein